MIHELIMTTFYFLYALIGAPVDVQVDLLENLTCLNAKLVITSRPLKVLEGRFPGAHRFSIVPQKQGFDTHIGSEISLSSEL